MSPRPVKTSAGYIICACVSCGAWPLRYVAETAAACVRDEWNWLRRCACCGNDLCLDCLNESASVCHACTRLRLELAPFLDARADDAEPMPTMRERAA